MSDVAAAVATFGLVAGILALTHAPLGAYLAHVFTTPKHLRVERGLYRLVGVDPDSEQRWSVYAVSVVAASWMFHICPP